MRPLTPPPSPRSSQTSGDHRRCSSAPGYASPLLSSITNSSAWPSANPALSRRRTLRPLPPRLLLLRASKAGEACRLTAGLFTKASATPRPQSHTPWPSCTQSHHWPTLSYWPPLSSSLSFPLSPTSVGGVSQALHQMSKAGGMLRSVGCGRDEFTFVPRKVKKTR
ncbi:hypothetical protein NL676_028593 [Syzygium grande]|nr:hypothetical protein NL676_028593 [Syzygium grande]